MYILLQNGQSVTSAIKVVRNLHNVEDVLSLKSQVLSVLVKYKSMLRSINHDCNMLCNVIHDINIQLSLNYVSRGKHTLP